MLFDIILMNVEIRQNNLILNLVDNHLGNQSWLTIRLNRVVTESLDDPEVAATEVTKTDFASALPVLLRNKATTYDTFNFKYYCGLYLELLGSKSRRLQGAEGCRKFDHMITERGRSSTSNCMCLA
jgi:hypothetical protein